MAENGHAHQKPMIVLFPFMAQGHIRPFLELAQLFHQKGYAITLINTPANIANLRRSLPLKSPIQLIEISFNPSDHGLPPDAENTESLPYHLILRLMEVSPALKSPLRCLLENLPEKPLCVVSDFFFGWAADVAHELGIFHAIFSCSSGFGLACYYSLWMNRPERDCVGGEFFLPDFPQAGKMHVAELPQSLTMNTHDDSPMTKFQMQNLPKWSDSDAIVFNTVGTIDSSGLDYFRRKLKIPMYPMGPIVSSPKTLATIEEVECIQWLSKKPPKSVIYISFGSQNTISASQTLALANALESSGRNFLWVFRPPLESLSSSSDFQLEKWLPSGFLDRIREDERGLITTKWAPQVEILANKSVGGFISHCGWNSILESLRHGVPMLCWPIGADQFYNAKIVVAELGVGVRMEAAAEEKMVEKIEMVMGGEKFRKRAEEVKGKIEDAMRDEDGYKGFSVEAMEEFLAAAAAATFAGGT